MRRLLIAAALAAPAVAVVPARAVPPVTITGSGYVSPGMPALCCVQPVYVSFTGTGDVPGQTYGCSFEGQGTYAPPTAVGTMQGSCGPYTYTGCTFTLDLASWKIACTTSAGTFAVTPQDVNPTTRFTATGAMA